MKKKLLFIILMSAVLLTGCSSNNGDPADYSSILKVDEIFSDKDLEQTVDTNDAVKYTVGDNQKIEITKEGVYVISGTGNDVTVVVDAQDEDKVQLVLSDLSINNVSEPCIYVKNADKVFITSVGSNSLAVTKSFSSDDETKTDAVIFSKDDLVFNGTGSINIQSSDNGITSKDDLKITGGTLTINSVNDALEANNSIAIKDGTVTIYSKKDGLHAEYDEDKSVGYIYIGGGTLTINASDDALHAITVIQIDDGTITTNSREGLEATYIQINGGTLTLSASDDGMNAAKQSSSYKPTIEINGGMITIDMGQGDTDAIDSNGYLYINGGTLDITAQSPFDYDEDAEYNGGKIIVNGKETNEITNQFAGGHPGGPGGR